MRDPAFSHPLAAYISSLRLPLTTPPYRSLRRRQHPTDLSVRRIWTMWNPRFRCEWRLHLLCVSAVEYDGRMSIVVTRSPTWGRRCHYRLCSSRFGADGVTGVLIENPAPQMCNGAPILFTHPSSCCSEVASPVRELARCRFTCGDDLIEFHSSRPSYF